MTDFSFSRSLVDTADAALAEVTGGFAISDVCVDLVLGTGAGMDAPRSCIFGGVLRFLFLVGVTGLCCDTLSRFWLLGDHVDPPLDGATIRLRPGFLVGVSNLLFSMLAYHVLVVGQRSQTNL